MPEGCALPKQGFQPSLSAWLGATVGGQPTFCAPIQMFWCFLLPRSLSAAAWCPLDTAKVTCPAAAPCSVPLWIQPWLCLGRPPLRTRCLLGCLPARCRSKAAVSIKWRKDGPNSCSVGFPACLPVRKPLLLSSSSSSCMSMRSAGDRGPVGSAGGGAAAAPEGAPGSRPHLASRQTDDVSQECVLPGSVQLLG